MIKLENIHTDAELLSVFKRLADHLAREIERKEIEVTAECSHILSHEEIEKIEEQVLEEFVAQENVLELPPLTLCTLCGEDICSCAVNNNQAPLKERFGAIGSLNLI